MTEIRGCRGVAIPPLTQRSETGVAEYGSPGGTPLLYFHGFPGSRLEASVADGVARRLGIRMIAFDRPGMGRSAFQRERTVADIARTASALADALGIVEFSVLGVSGGAPYALACGIRLPGRVTRIGLVSPAGPFSEGTYRAALGWSRSAALRLGTVAPFLFRNIVRRALRLMRSDPERFFRLSAQHSGSPDREIILAHLPLFVENLREAFREGESGPVQEAELLVRPWGFRPADAKQPVFLWHGGRDVTVPHSVGARLAAEIPHCHAFFPPEEGHFSLAVGLMEEILATLIDG